MMKKRFMASIALSGTLVAGACLSRVLAQESQPSLDDLLNLPSTQPKEPAQPQQPGQPEQPGQRGDAAPQPPRIFDDQLREQLEESPAQQLFEAAIREMDDAALMLQQQQDPGIGTQRIQESILAKLEQVIKEARKNQRQSRSQSQSQSRPQDSPSQNAQSQAQQNQPQPGGVDPNRGLVAPGSVRDVVGQDEGAMGEVGREWGNLPPRLRQELQQGTQEHFSPVYRSLTERYYQRLSQESGQ